MAMMSIASTAGGEDSDGGVCAKLRALPPRDDAGLSGLDAPPSKARILSNPAASVGGGGGVAAAKRVDVSTDDVDEGAECLGGRLDLCGVRAEDDAPGESNPGDSPVGSLSRTNSSARSGHRRDRAAQAAHELAPFGAQNDADRREPEGRGAVLQHALELVDTIGADEDAEAVDHAGPARLVVPLGRRDHSGSHRAPEPNLEEALCDAPPRERQDPLQRLWWSGRPHFDTSSSLKNLKGK